LEGVLSPETLDEVAWQGARAMLRHALEVEVAAYLERHQERDAGGHALVVRNGKARARTVTCGAGTLTVEARRAMFVGDSPAASFPRRIGNASWKSPVDSPRRYSTGSTSATLGERRM
jgi:hypothetical protein